MSLAGGGLRDTARWVQRRIGSHALILVYHRVMTLESDPWKISVSPANFAAQLAVIKRSFRPQPLADLHADLRAGKLRHLGVLNHRTPETVNLVREAGFARACINISKLTTHRTQPFQLPRLQVHDWDGPTFERELAAWLPKH